jgi:hypothetical protein
MAAVHGGRFVPYRPAGVHFSLSHFKKQAAYITACMDWSHKRRRASLRVVN